MMDYFAAHQFRLSANLHGGAEVMNYPWDSFTSSQNSHPAADWWREVCQRFVDTARVYGNSHFRDVTSSGYIAGGDWYVITGGRQDYVNYTYNCLELTMEISTQKTLGSDRLPEYWHFLAPSLIHYIGEIHSLPDNVGITNSQFSILNSQLSIYPNPTTDQVTVSGLPEGSLIELYDTYGRRVISSFNSQFSILNLKNGLYLLRTAVGTAKVIKH